MKINVEDITKIIFFYSNIPNMKQKHLKFDLCIYIFNVIGVSTIKVDHDLLIILFL